MVMPEVDLDHLRPEIEERIIRRKESQKELLRWLASKSIVVQRKTLQRRINQWGLPRRGLSIEPKAIEQVEYLFHYTTKDDAAIAADLNAQGLHLTALQVLRRTRQVKSRRGDLHLLSDARQIYAEP